MVILVCPRKILPSRIFYTNSELTFFPRSVKVKTEYHEKRCAKRTWFLHPFLLLTALSMLKYEGSDSYVHQRNQLSISQWPGYNKGLELQPFGEAPGRNPAHPWLRRTFPTLPAHDQPFPGRLQQHRAMVFFILALRVVVSIKSAKAAARNEPQ